MLTVVRVILYLETIYIASKHINYFEYIDKWMI